MRLSDLHVVCPQSRGGDAHDERDDGGHHNAYPDRQPQAQIEGEHDNADRVRAGCHEGDLPEVQQSGVAELDVEADGGQAIDDRLDADGLGEGLCEDETPIHVTHPLSSAEDALRPDHQDHDHHEQRRLRFSSRLESLVTSTGMNTPTTRAPTDRLRYTGAQSAEDDGG
jgi:hypothetical protein